MNNPFKNILFAALVFGLGYGHTGSLSAAEPKTQLQSLAVSTTPSGAVSDSSDSLANQAGDDFTDGVKGIGGGFKKGAKLTGQAFKGAGNVVAQGLKKAGSSIRSYFAGKKSSESAVEEVDLEIQNRSEPLDAIGNDV